MKAKLKFADKVYKLTALIPRGKITTYKQIALTTGKPQASRAVGNALNRNPYAPQVPCHRVIRSTGEIGGFASGTKKKIAILKKEGVVVKQGKIDLTVYLYEFKAQR